MADIGVLSYPQIVDQLVALCGDQESGTLFLALEDNRSARLVLDQGNICWVAFQELRGSEALDRLADIKTARLSFNPALRLVLGNQNLPRTTDILQHLLSTGQLGKGADAGIAERALADADVGTTPNATPPEGPETEGKRFNLDHVRLVLERESIEYLGPMAIALCDEYLEDLPKAPGLAQVRQVIVKLAQDISDQKQARQFSERAERGLGIH